MNIRAALLAIGLIGQLALTGLAHADIVVVVSRDSWLRELTVEQISDIYLGRRRGLLGGAAAQVMEQPRDSPTRERFFRLLNGMTLRQLNAYWARLQFSGQVLPPTTLLDDKTMISVVSSSRWAIGYVDASMVDDSVQVLLLLKDKR